VRTCRYPQFEHGTGSTAIEKLSLEIADVDVLCLSPLQHETLDLIAPALFTELQDAMYLMNKKGVKTKESAEIRVWCDGSLSRLRCDECGSETLFGAWMCQSCPALLCLGCADHLVVKCVASLSEHLKGTES
jgi:hypothetical protein